MEKILKRLAQLPLSQVQEMVVILEDSRTTDEETGQAENLVFDAALTHLQNVMSDADFIYFLAQLDDRPQISNPSLNPWSQLR